ncbi:MULTISPECIES: ribosome maturation factor RimP [Terrabacteria group]|uniref:ribosome maturation factor RimP n=1 Tax=Bacillati TaxID=1783272 RepID=UPI00193A36CD|nr:MULTISPECIES: ribosome maturation factor RimP [Terrabacteria group]MBW9211885.1 hypothetical protein [Trueperella sp. zg.1013]QRG87312.1 ribosome maturation factor RimP [Bulleidia sp. zg-1006]
MKQISEIEALLSSALQKHGFEVEEVKWISDEKTLQISVNNLQGETDLDACAKANEWISEILDEKDPIPEEYNLEVCSPGAEREIKDIHLIQKETYVHVDFKEAVNQHQSLEGYLSVTEKGYMLQYREKAVLKKIVLDEKNIAFIRHAVKV